MVLVLILALALVSCTSYELDNPNDPRNNPNVVYGSSSSSSMVSSSSGELPSSNSSVASSSSSVQSSSSSLVSSSSSVQSSSSSLVSSSSSVQSSSSSLVSSSSRASSSSTPAVADCEGLSFNTVTIDKQVWMAENLNCNISGSKCYDNDEKNCATYGRLYDWATVMKFTSTCNSNSCTIQSKHKGICPESWHIPTKDEWDTLIVKVGIDNAGEILKAKSGWTSSGNGTNTSGFSALPGGRYSGSKFQEIGDRGFWWTASENNNNTTAKFMVMDYSKKTVDSANYNKSGNYISVRCVRN